MRSFKIFAFFILMFGVIFVNTARADETFKIGGIFSLTEIPKFTKPAQQTAQVMIDDINRRGGLMGRKIELLVRDDQGDPTRAIRAAEELILNEDVDLMFVIALDHISVALSDVSKRYQKIMMSAWGTDNNMTWKNGHDYIYVIEPAPYVQSKQYAMTAAKNPAKKWAFVATNDVLGRGLVKDLKENLKDARPDIEFVAEQYPAWSQLSTEHVRAVARAEPDAVYTALYDDDLVRFIIEGKKLGIIDDLYQQHIALGWYQDADTLADQTPLGSYSSGCPADLDYGKDADLIHRILKATGKPDLGCAEIQIITAFKFIEAAVNKAQSFETDDIRSALSGLEIDMFLGEVEMRAIDHRSTLGYWHGYMGMVDGRPRLTDYFRLDVNALSPSDEEILEMRKSH